MRGHAQCIATSDDAMLTWTKRPDPVIAAPPAELVPRALRDQPTRWMARGRSDDHLKPGHLPAWQVSRTPIPVHPVPSPAPAR